MPVLSVRRCLSIGSTAALLDEGDASLSEVPALIAGVVWAVAASVARLTVEEADEVLAFAARSATGLGAAGLSASAGAVRLLINRLVAAGSLSMLPSKPAGGGTCTAGGATVTAGPISGSRSPV